MRPTLALGSGPQLLKMSASSRPIGPNVLSTKPAQRPTSTTTLTGRYVTLKHLEPAHASAFYAHISGAENAWLWDYMFDGPFHDADTFNAAVASKSSSEDPMFYAIVPNNVPTIPGSAGVNGGDGAARDNIVGWASHMRIDTTHRCIELGNIMYSPKLQGSPASTEVSYLMARHALEDLGFRRYEWKCDALNAPSRKAALRLGFMFEGIFRKHLIVKGHNRDTAWFSMVDDEWPAVKEAMERWLDPSNFDEQGVQRKRLEEFRQ
ncbi:acetyltransferase [Xylariaceae sp. FL0255]|nr:acetyltransferase [Xylariaceae sp. FL0255]